MTDIAIIKLVSGAEIIGRRASNPMNAHVLLEEALSVLMRPTEDGRVQIGLLPLSLSIAVEPGQTGHPAEIYPEHILAHGAPTEEVASAYRQATSRLEIASALPVRRIGAA
ncbi:MAG: hypothetical protein ACREA0_11480 [bacterium]